MHKDTLNYHMTKLVILGAFSNICKIKVFDNLSACPFFEKIVCYDRIYATTESFQKYLETEIIGDTNNILGKIEYVYGNFDDYEQSIKSFLDENTIEVNAV